jgi:DNA-binding response OmpR family regulator
MTQRILVVEDDPELAKMWTYLLQRHGYKVQTAYNVRDAITTYKSKPANLVLLDYYLPDQYGTTLLEYIRADRNLPRPRTVLLTSNPYFKPEAYNNLVDAFVLKPAYPQQIMNLVKTFLPPRAS